jgi:hypothetical protein
MLVDVMILLVKSGFRKIMRNIIDNHWSVFLWNPLRSWGNWRSTGVESMGPVVPLSPPNFVVSCEQLSVIAAINGGELVLVLCFFW